MKYLLSLLLLILSGCTVSNFCYLPTAEITDMYAQYIDEWKSQVKVAFDEAEANIFIVTPKPDVVVGPNEDPAKCICKGTGIIIQGDNHKTLCPFHGKSSSRMKSVVEQKGLIIQQSH
ncbi:hypothetical protein EBZ38_04790 [bacterium]|nr:hypothetical protein [bacterium]